MFPEKKIKKYLHIPFPSISSSLLYLNTSIFYIFEKKIKNDYRIYGIGKIDVNNNYLVNTYPLNILIKDTNKSEANSFKITAVSQNELIIHLAWNTFGKTPKPHFFFCFDLNSKKWTRIVSIDKNGINKREINCCEKDNNILTEESAYFSSDGKIIVWSTGPGKIRIEKDERPCDNYGIALDENEESIKFYKSLYAESSLSKEHIFDKAFLPVGDNLNPLKLQKIVMCKDTFDIITYYKIYNLPQYLLQNEELLKKNITERLPYIFNTGSIFYNKNSENFIGVFINYIFPREKTYGVFLEFNT